MTQRPPRDDDPPDDYDGDGDESDPLGLASVVLVNPKDDVAAICGRVDTAPTFAVVVHAPRGNRQLATELGMRRLQRHAEEGGKLVAVATTSSALATRARQVGLPVARRPDRVRWDSAGRRVLRLGNRSILIPAVGGFAQAFVLLLAAALFIGLALTMAPSADVIVTPPAETLTDVLTITASRDRDTIDFATLAVPAREVSAKITVTLAVRTTGKAPVGTTQAKALVTITNPGTAAVEIPKSTVLLAGADAQPFQLDLATSVPAGQSVTQQATATRPGSRGNVPAGAITAWLEPAYRALRVTNPAAAAGGADENRQAVDPNDITALNALAQDLSKSESLRAKLVAERPRDAVFLRTASTTIDAGDPSDPVGTPTDILLMDVQVTVKALAILEETLDLVARDRLLAGQGGGELLPGSITATETGARQEDTSRGTVTTEIKVSGLFARNITREGIRDAVKGKSRGDAESTLAGRYGIQDSDVRLSPGWAPWVPRFGFRISVVLRGIDTSAGGVQGTASANAPTSSPTPAPGAATPRP
ncbi:MAG: baseplate J/gp47 family protein [Chloroflexi bacterium]|nr:baseplate J/gp47 family protein [Chloroflexota bacterium]